jgi:hypothetical protein
MVWGRRSLGGSFYRHPGRGEGRRGGERRRARHDGGDGANWRRDDLGRWGCGGQISPGSTRRIKDLTKGPRAP